MNYGSENHPIAFLQAVAERVRSETTKVLVGQEDVVELLLVALFTRGHVLLEGVPGTAKTLMAKLLAHLVQADYRRVQFTADLMPSDVVGTVVFDIQSSRFNLKRGPIFTQILLADEINRAPAITQAALLEAMEERQVSIEGETIALAEPFMVIATQNPVEMDGTYPLPEAQLDRFFMKLSLGYLDEASESQMLLNLGRAHPIESLKQVVDGHELPKLARQVWDVHVDDTVRDYIVRLTFATRRHKDLILGASPRGSHALYRGIQAYAAVQGRDYTLPDDVKKLAPAILSHRCLIHPESALRGHTNRGILKEIMEATPLDIGELE